MGGSIDGLDLLFDVTPSGVFPRSLRPVMSTTQRATTYAHRGAILLAIAAWRADPTADPTLLETENLVFAPTRAAWSDAVATHDALRQAVRANHQESGKASEDLTRDHRAWRGSLRDAKGKVRTAELTMLLGGQSAGALAKASLGKRAMLFRRMLEQLSGRVDLQGDASLLAAFRASVVAAEEAATRYDASERAWKAHIPQMHAAASAFDQAYRRLVYAFQGIAGGDETWKILPRFRKSSPKRIAMLPTAVPSNATATLAESSTAA